MGVRVGVIGGSGFYKFLTLENQRRVKIDTPFGVVNSTVGDMHGKTIIFIPRHGEKHSVPPHRINYRANTYAMHLMGVKYVVSTSAVGSLREKYRPGEFLIPDQIIDFTKSRTYTFFDGEFTIEVEGEVRGGVYHVDVTSPYCEKLRKIIYDAALDLGMNTHFGGTYVCTEGPRFETPAEIKFFQIIGGDVVGMTNSPEVFLFKELNICYATICVITNYAAGMQERVSHEEVIELFKRKIQDVVKLVTEVIKRI